MQDGIVCDAKFSCDPSDALAVLHMLNKGAPPFMRVQAPDTAEGKAEFSNMFDSTHMEPGAQRADFPVCQLRDGDQALEVVLVPMIDQRQVQAPDGTWSQESRECFWCYRIVPGSLLAAMSWLKLHRMPLVLDLDDTLVVANGEGAMRDKRERVRSCFRPCMAPEAFHVLFTACLRTRGTMWCFTRSVRIPCGS